jgi:hypothetical protein
MSSDQEKIDAFAETTRKKAQDIIWAMPNQPTLFESITGRNEPTTAPTVPAREPYPIAGRAYCKFCDSMQTVIDVGDGRMLFEHHPDRIALEGEDRWKRHGYYCIGSRMRVSTPVVPGEELK